MPAQVLDDASHHARQDLAHLVGREAWQLREGDARLPLGVRAVEEEHVQMGMELQVGARTLHDDDGAALSARHAFLPQSLTVEAEHGAHTDARHGSE